MRDACGQQTERGKLLILEDLLFEANPLRDVIEKDEPPDAFSRLPDQRDHRNIDHQVAPLAVLHVEFVEAGDALIAECDAISASRSAGSTSSSLRPTASWRGTPI